VPVNTPQENVQNGLEDTAKSKRVSILASVEKDSAVKFEADEGTPVPIRCSSIVGSIKSRKENIQESLGLSEGASGLADGTRKVAQPFNITIGSSNKRQRIITPAAFKVIDEEDEPRSSPTLRKVSQGVTLQEAKDGERRALSGIQPNIV